MPNLKDNNMTQYCIRCATDASEETTNYKHTCGKEDKVCVHEFTEDSEDCMIRVCIKCENAITQYPITSSSSKENEVKENKKVFYLDPLEKLNKEDKAQPGWTVELADEGTVLCEFQKKRTELLSEMFDNVDDIGIYPTGVFYAKLNKYFQQTLEADRKSRLEEVERQIDGFHLDEYSKKELVRFHPNAEQVIDVAGNMLSFIKGSLRVSIRRIK